MHKARLRNLDGRSVISKPFKGLGRGSDSECRGSVENKLKKISLFSKRQILILIATRYCDPSGPVLSDQRPYLFLQSVLEHKAQIITSLVNLINWLLGGKSFYLRLHIFDVIFTGLRKLTFSHFFASKACNFCIECLQPSLKYVNLEIEKSKGGLA